MFVMVCVFCVLFLDDEVICVMEDVFGDICVWFLRLFRWLESSDWYVMIKFYGDVLEDQVGELGSDFVRIAWELNSILVEICVMGVFFDMCSFRVLWVGVWEKSKDG